MPHLFPIIYSYSCQWHALQNTEKTSSTSIVSSIREKSKSLRSSDYENTELAEASEREDMDCFKPWKVQLATFHFYFRTQLSVFSRLACVQPYKFVMQNKGIHVLNKNDWIICFVLLALEALIKKKKLILFDSVSLVTWWKPWNTNGCCSVGLRFNALLRKNEKQWGGRRLCSFTGD